AIWAAEHGRNTLIISTDPAHSLGDSLGMDLAPGVPTQVEGIPNLTALEINPEVNMSELKNLTSVNPMEEMGMDGMMGGMMEGLGMGDIQDLASSNPPGIDEALAFGKVLEFIETKHEYDLIVFDTAPTGHTLRFLSLPETLSSWVGKILKLRLKIGKLFGAFKGMFSKEQKKKDNSLEMLEKFAESIEKGREDLTNPLKNNFIIVMIPEEMAIAETGRLINELVKYQIPNDSIVINQLYQDDTELCAFCRGRRNMQQKNLEKIRSLFGQKLGKNLVEVPLFEEEIREYQQLKKMSEYLVL
ncbi:MAG: TRC40/GET3/ArsA family transport-energizing ATPase, partial [Candidatus Lokiarchaeota archaeon]|nr:TRC40/GET3/ArsA family transport-energizing ATPase [Candidatus Lokiarchaeota archaeon]